jgi:hypothetical protein
MLELAGGNAADAGVENVEFASEVRKRTLATAL